MNDSIISFKLALLGEKVNIQFKDNEEAKVAFPKLVKDLEDYVNSKEYLALMAKEAKDKKLKKIKI